MAQELTQSSTDGTGAAAFIDDKTGNRSLHMVANARIVTSLIGVMSQTSPTLVGLGGDTVMTLPPKAVPIALTIFGKAGAATANATIQIGLDTTTNYFLSTSVSNVGGGGVGYLIPRETAQLFTALANLPIGQAHAVTGNYAEAGTSGSGGPWYVEIDYYLPNPA